MRLSCIHCGQQFSITADQLGGRGHCPHCRGEIELPRADGNAEDGDQRLTPGNLLENSVSGLASMIIHMLLFILACLITWGGAGLAGDTEQVNIGVMPTYELDQEQADEQLSAAEDVDTEKDSDLDDPLEDVAPPTPEASVVPSINLLAAPPTASGGSPDFNLTSTSAGGGMGGSWDGMIQQLRRNGLDIVIAFDSTGSMSGEINQVKRQIGRIGDTLTKMVPKTRIGICTYRDDGRSEEYLVKGLPLTNDIQEVEAFLQNCFASGGGDHAEAVQEGLRWPMQNNEFRSRARKVILVFGDAPPHQDKLGECLRLAGDFSAQQKGIISTVTCRSNFKLQEFIDIAQMGGGEAFLTSDERQIMTQLLVLVFGSQYRTKVIEAFRLLEE